MWLSMLLAQVRPAKRDPFREPEVIWGTIGLIVALLVGAFLVWAVERWRKRAQVTPDAKEELTDYRSMYERGEITEGEYIRLRDRVSHRVKEAPAATQGGTTQSQDAQSKDARLPDAPPRPESPPYPPPNEGGDWKGGSV